MAPSQDDTVCWIGLSSIPGVGRATFRKLVGRFGSPEAVLGASSDELIEKGRVPEQTARAITSTLWRDAAEREAVRARKAGVDIVTFDDPGYPDRLKSIPDPPLFLYVKGRLHPGDKSSVAVVGTRTPTHYGLTVAHRLAYELAANGNTVVSGMARGIDTEAHTGALAARGRTIAVLACGIDKAYPPENRDLMAQIAASGAVVTENPFGTRPESGYFPARNRIISGLSAGTVIVEAAEDSGSLITADYALQQGRMLFAVPGNAGSPTSRGTNSLIKRGAELVETAGDVLGHLGQRRSDRCATPAAGPPLLTNDEETVLRAVTSEPMHIDAIGVACGNPPGMLSGILTALELKGLIRQLPGKYFIKDTA